MGSLPLVRRVRTTCSRQPSLVSQKRSSRVMPVTARRIADPHRPEPASAQRGTPSCVPLYRVGVAVAHASLGRRRTLEASALRDLPLATVPRELAVRQVVEQTCARAGFAPRVLFEETNVPTLLALARHGVAYAIVSSEALDEAPDMPAARLAERGRPIEREMSLQWRSEASLSPSARQLRDVLCESAARSSGRRRSRRP